MKRFEYPSRIEYVLLVIILAVGITYAYCGRTEPLPLEDLPPTDETASAATPR